MVRCHNQPDFRFRRSQNQRFLGELNSLVILSHAQVAEAFGQQHGQIVGREPVGVLHALHRPLHMTGDDQDIG